MLLFWCYIKTLVRIILHHPHPPTYPSFRINKTCNGFLKVFYYKSISHAQTYNSIIYLEH